MVRGTLVGLVRHNDDVNLAVENVARYHISAIRRRQNGEILAVKHIQFGWIGVDLYYQIQKLHDLIPIAVSVIQGGYLLKGAIWSYELPVQVLGSGSGIPMGLVIVSAAVALYVIDTVAGNQLEAFLDLASLLLPFGEVWIMWRGGDLIRSWITGSQSKVAQGGAGQASVGVDLSILSLFGGGQILLDAGLGQIVEGIATTPAAKQFVQDLESSWSKVL